MAVVVVPKFNKQQIRAMLGERKERIKAAILLNLQRIGETFVTQARDTDTYKDRTGNLRSSIGYVILYNGEQMFESFKSTGGPQGVEKARQVVEEVKQNFPSGYVLIGVAGMNYAAAVEAKGFDVITSSALHAETALRVAIKRIESKIK
ncbi:MAG: hypothetical protein ABIT05_01385 [Chitinophagaceae bacterium]